MNKPASRWTISLHHLHIPGIGYDISGPGAYQRITSNTNFSLVALESSKTFMKLKDTYKITGVRSFLAWIREHKDEHADTLNDVFTELSAAGSTYGTIKIDLQFTSNGPPVEGAFGYMDAFRVASKTLQNEIFTTLSLSAPTEDTGAGHGEVYDLPTRENHSSIDTGRPLFKIKKHVTHVPVDAKVFSVARLESSPRYSAMKASHKIRDGVNELWDWLTTGTNARDNADSLQALYDELSTAKKERLTVNVRLDYLASYPGVQSTRAYVSTFEISPEQGLGGVEVMSAAAPHHDTGLDDQDGRQLVVNNNTSAIEVAAAPGSS